MSLAQMSFLKLAQKKERQKEGLTVVRNLIRLVRKNKVSHFLREKARIEPQNDLSVK